MRRFKDRVALITGAAHGIGRAIAARLASEGASVVVADLDGDAGARAAHELEVSGATALAVGCDVTDRADVVTAIATAVGHFGRLDVLVNNVGIASPTPFEEIDDDGWQQQMDPTLNGAVRCIQEAIPHLLVSPVGGNVVSVGSVNGLAAIGGGLAYSAAKAGLQSLTQNLAAQYGRHGLRFNLVAPGTIRTRVWEPTKLEQQAQLYPLGRVGDPEDVAAAVAYLASDDAAWVTGVVLPIDGGLLVSSKVSQTSNGITPQRK